MRIVGGQWRSRVLTFPDAPGLRPTPDRVRETLFNWLGQTLDGLVCLDLFAGSGALALEALSRGAAQAVAVERDRRVADALRANARLLGADRLVVVEADALEFLARNARRFDVIFLDPPFHQDWLPQLLPELGCCVAADGLVYIETEQEFLPPPDWQRWKSGRAGSVHYQLVKRDHVA